MSLQWGRDEAVLGFGEGVAEGQALVRIDPAGDPRVHALGLEVQELAQRAEARTIASDADVRVATLDLGLLKGLRETFEEKRRGFTVPLNDYLKDINAAFREYTGPLERAWRLNEGKVQTFQDEQKRIIEEEERINRLRNEAARAEMELKGELTEPVNLVEVAPPPPLHYRTPVGDLGTVKTKKWEVEDLSKVPLDYLMIDATRVGRVVRAGIPSIPGIRIWEAEGLRITRPK